MHAQANAPGLLEFLRDAKPRVFKSVNDVTLCKLAHEASPETAIIYRKVENNWDQYIYGPKGVMHFLKWMEPELKELAQYFGSAPVYIEGLNETIASGAVEDIKRVVQFEAQFAYELAALPWINALPVVLNTAVGNPHHGEETEMLRDAFMAAYETGGAVGYHPYWPAI